MNNYIPVITRQHGRKVETDKVVYIQQQQRRLAIVTDDETFVYYEKVDNVLKYLDERFFRIMKKLVVNLEKISCVKEQCVTFQNGAQLYMGRENYVKTKQRYAAYLRNLF